VFFIVTINEDKSIIYKIPVGSKQCVDTREWSINNTDPFIYICLNTYYTETYVWGFSKLRKTIEQDTKYFLTYKPLYFNRLRYVGKGFKLLLKKKKFFNCIFGHSHIYWVKIQNIKIKKTKKYKFFFVAKNISLFNKIVNILKKVKPINRYTLRGVRTYTHTWIKYKGRKSVAKYF